MKNKTNKKFFNKNETVLQIPASEFVKLDGHIKMDPTSNVRTSNFILEFDKLSTKEILKYSAKETIRNNLDQAELQSDIFEDGYSKTKQAILVAPLSEYLRGKDNRKNIVKIYKDDVAFIQRVKDIVSVFETESNESKLQAKLEELSGYYMVIGGNTRVSMILEKYFEDENAFEVDGSMNTEIPVSVTSFADMKLIDEKLMQVNEEFTSESAYKLETVSQILWEAAVLTDNAKSKQNVPCHQRFVARGKLARKMVKNAFFENTKDCVATQTIADYARLIRRMGSDSARFLEALFYVNIYDYLKVNEERGLTASWEEHLTFVCKVLAGICTSDKKPEGVAYQKFISSKTGFNYQTLEVEKPKNLVKFINWVVECHELSTAPASNLFKPLRHAMHTQGKKVVLDSKVFKEAKEKAKNNFLVWVPKNQKDIIEELDKAKKEAEKNRADVATWRNKYAALCNKIKVLCEATATNTAVSKDHLASLLSV